MTFAGDLWKAWVDLEEALPPRHHMLISGPTKDGMYTVSVIRNTTPTALVARGRGDLTEAFRDAKDALDKYLKTL